jgi:hypothetical protein
MKNPFLSERQERQPLTVVALLFLILISPLPASAGEVLLSALGSGQWQVSAIGLANIHALDLDLRYDAQRLPGLTATAGAGLSGAMTAINDKSPGTIRLGVASTQPLASDGVLLQLRTSAPGGEMVVSRFTVKTVDADGKGVATVVRQQLPAPSPLPEILPSTPVASTTTPASPLPLAAGTAPSHGGYGGSPPVVADESSPPPPRQEEEVIPPAPLPAVPPASSSLSGIPASLGAEKHFHSQEEIVIAIERLPRPWTVAAVKAIFLASAKASPVRQVPAVVFADGKSRLKLYLPKTLSPLSPSVAVQGCTLGTIVNAGEQGWAVEIITRQEIWPAKALLLGEGDLIQFPLVIVPSLAITPPFSDNATIPAVDFDGNGVITALDAYLYVGNLLAQ